MNLLLSELPGTHPEIVVWLEHHVVGLQLSRLVAELAAVHGAQRPAESAREFLGVDLDRVLTAGLGALSRVRLAELLKQPFHLFELQELALSVGGRYWRQREAERPLPQRAGPTRLGSGSGEPRPSERPDPRTGNWAAIRVVGLLAAGVVVGFAACYLWLAGPVFPPKGPTAPAVTVWGWNKPEATGRADTPRAYLSRLADLAEEWYAGAPQPGVPNRKQLLVIRLLELRGGCTRLSIADHPLPVGMRDTLSARANEWCGEIDVLLQRVQEAADLSVWTPSIDELLRRIIGDLRAGRLEP